MAESKSDLRITTDTPKLAREGEVWCVYCEDCEVGVGVVGGGLGMAVSVACGANVLENWKLVMLPQSEGCDFYPPIGQQASQFTCGLYSFPCAQIQLNEKQNASALYIFFVSLGCVSI